MSEFYVYHHLGLGDHFICNGLVRELIIGKDDPYLFVKHHNLDTVSQMYKDTNLSFVPVDDDGDVYNFCYQKTINGKQIGFAQLNENSPFDQQFYQLAGVPFQKRWDSFKLNRDKKREQSLIYGLNLPEKFALLHEDESRNYKIDRSKINLPIVKLRPIAGFTMIDWLGVVDLADEIHVIDSSFMFLLDSVETKVPLYVHRYSRSNPSWQLPTLKKNWLIL